MATVCFQWSTIGNDDDAAKKKEVCCSLDAGRRHSKYIATLIDDGHVAMENDRLVIDCDGLDALQDQVTVQRFVEFVEHHHDILQPQMFKKMMAGAINFNYKLMLSAWDQTFLLRTDPCDVVSLMLVADYLQCDLLLACASAFAASRCIFSRQSETLLPQGLKNLFHNDDVRDPFEQLGGRTTFVCDLLCPTFDHAFKHPLESIKMASAHVDRFWYSKTATSPMTKCTRYFSPTTGDMCQLIKNHLEANTLAYVSLSLDDENIETSVKHFAPSLRERQHIELRSPFTAKVAGHLLSLLYKNHNLKVLRLVCKQPPENEDPRYLSLLRAIGFIRGSPLESLDLCFWIDYNPSCWAYLPHSLRKLWISGVDDFENSAASVELEELGLFGRSPFNTNNRLQETERCPSELWLPPTLKSLYLAHFTFYSWDVLPRLLKKAHHDGFSLYLCHCSIIDGATSSTELDNATLVDHGDVEDLSDALLKLMERNDENEDTFALWESELDDDGALASIKVTEGHAHPQLE